MQRVFANSESARFPDFSDAAEALAKDNQAFYASRQMTMLREAWMTEYERIRESRLPQIDKEAFRPFLSGSFQDSIDAQDDEH